MKKKIFDIISIIIIILSIFYIVFLFIGINNNEPYSEYFLGLSIILSVFTAGAIYQLIKKE